MLTSWRLVKLSSLGGYFRQDWTHEAHFAVPIYLLCRRPDIDLDHDIASLWKASNDSLGIENTDTAGYHETITRVYLTAVRDFAASHGGGSLVEMCNAVLLSPAAARSYPLTFYTSNRLFSVEARRHWIPPDVIPLYGAT